MVAPSARPDAPAGRFFAAIERLIGAEAAAADRFVLAVSGGPDSMAMLALATRALPGRLVAASVDHGLRAGSGEEAEMVAAWCRARAVPHHILRPEMPIAGNIQSAARRARYGLLEQCRLATGCDWILTAHHSDDQAETVLMRLNRGAGVGGLAGVRARNGRVLRPLLDWRRTELAELVAAGPLPHVSDPSNRDPRFDRVVMRARLAEAGWIDARALARSAGALAEAQEALVWSVDQLAAAHIWWAEPGARLILDRTDLPREYLRRLLLALIARFAPDFPAPRGDTLDQAIVQLCAGKKAMIGDMLIKGGETWELCRAPARR